MSRASLPMYDLAPVRRVTDAWWQGLARAFTAEGIDDVPTGLDRARSREANWIAPDLLLAQTCGYPLMHEFRDRMALVAVPCYAAPGAEGSRYGSFIVIREDNPAHDIADLRGAIATVNGPDSHSGMNAFRHVVAPHAEEGRFFGQVVVSGSHPQSLELIQCGKADAAAIDCITHALLSRHAPEATAGTRILAKTALAPALPYVTRIDAPDDLLRRLRAGLRRALQDADLAAVRDALLIDNFVECPIDIYNRMLEMAVAAAERGYPDLA